jgi:hypothetical protein
MRVDVDVFTLADDPASPNDWLWYVYLAIATWLLIVHVIAFYFVGGRIWSRVRARFANSRVSVAVQCSRLPDVLVTTVEGLRSELRARTPNQAIYLDSMASHDITFGIGPAGTGKT